MSLIHSTALIDPLAELDASVRVGPYCIIGPHVRIEAGTVLDSHVVIDGRTSIGRDNHFHAFSVVGGVPQDKKYAVEPTRLEIGSRNTIREYCTFSLGTAQDEGVTRVGDDNWIMAYVHVAHDCQVGNQTIFANNATLAGHVHVGDWVILGGFSAVHQFCKIGSHVMLGMNTSLSQDVPPFMLVSGHPATPFGINIEGLKRRGFSREQIGALRAAYKTLYKAGLTLEEAKTALAEQAQAAPESAVHLLALREFLAHTTRGIIR